MRGWEAGRERKSGVVTGAMSGEKTGMETGMKMGGGDQGGVVYGEGGLAGWRRKKRMR